MTPPHRHTAYNLFHTYKSSDLVCAKEVRTRTNKWSYVFNVYKRYDETFQTVERTKMLRSNICVSLAAFERWSHIQKKNIVLEKCFIASWKLYIRNAKYIYLLYMVDFCRTAYFLYIVRTLRLITKLSRFFLYHFVQIRQLLIQVKCLCLWWFFFA